jgi:hypothetical protein
MFMIYCCPLHDGNTGSGVASHPVDDRWPIDFMAKSHTKCKGLPSTALQTTRAVGKKERQVVLRCELCCRYLAFGSSMDYMYTDAHVPYSLTFEVKLFPGPTGGKDTLLCCSSKNALNVCL